ncbi:PEP-utilizing enzyme [Elusimicrobiota bacterium]
MYKTIAYTFVMADLFHFGHLQLLKAAKENADYHICGVISDEACHIWWGNNICNYEERKAVIESIDFVDEVMRQDTMNPIDNIKAIKDKYPRARIVVVHGDDWRTVPGREYIESIGGKIIQPEYYSQLSRDAIIKKIKHSIPSHPLKHEYFTQSFRVGNIVQFSSQKVSELISTKADTLMKFRRILKSCEIEKLFICTVRDFHKYKAKTIKAVKKQFTEGKLIIRSSSVNEDRYNASMAGYYKSVNNIDPKDEKDIELGIKKVIESYGKGDKLIPDDQILIQSQTADVIKSGVVFTRNLDTNAPYYLINYDESEKTDTVTGGEISSSLWLYRDIKISRVPRKWRNLLTAVKEIEDYLPGMVLDIEFAEKADGTIVIFQVRPLAANVRFEEFNDDMFRSIVERQIANYDSQFLSDMAFWNPSEIIGDNPHPLDYSIYREIITRRAWNAGLTHMGYSPVKQELMVKYGNKPYISLEHAFQALIPGSLPGKLRNKLKEFYIRKLSRDLTAHDKIEFEIALSCYDFDSEERLEELQQNGFTKKEINDISAALKKLTLTVIKSYRKRLEQDQQSLKTLSLKTKDLLKESVKYGLPAEYIKAFLKLLEYIEIYGTPQFTTVAREAFISKSLLNSMVNVGLSTRPEIDEFLQGISSITTEFDRDFKKYACGDMEHKKFLRKYGHLRAGTYDITSPKYGDMEFKSLSGVHVTEKKESSSAGLNKNKLEKILKSSKISNLNAADLRHFLTSTIKQREYFKFEFTRSLSLALEFLAAAGEMLGLTREDMAYLDLPVIKASRFYNDEKELMDFWKLNIKQKKIQYAENSKLIMSPVIQNSKDFKIINSWISRPNFITDRIVKCETACLDSNKKAKIKGKIVLIEKADPGYDWIFTQNIKGLITKYGGLASHMAIRCAEFNIPAAIGCGKQIYSKLTDCKRIKLDCKRKQVLPS